MSALLKLKTPGYSVSDCAEMTGYPRQRIYQAIYKGELAARERTIGQIKIAPEDFERWWAAEVAKRRD